MANFEAFAQSETHKDVVLDGKPAKLNVKTGEVVKDKASVAKMKTQDSIKPKTEIQANLITDTRQSKRSKTEKVIVTSKPDTLRDYYKKLHLKNAKVGTVIANDSLSGSVNAVQDVILIVDEPVESDTNTAYDEASSSYASNNGKYLKSTTDFHLVQKGETLYALAQLYNTTLGQLKQANNLETTLIQVGQQLRISNFSAENVDSAAVWIVSKGDTLYSIARKNFTTVAAIKERNGLTSNLIIPGQKLQLK